MAGLHTADEVTPAMAHKLPILGFHINPLSAPSTSEPFFVEAMDQCLSFDSGPYPTPTTNFEHSSLNNHRQGHSSAVIQSPAKMGHQTHIRSEASELSSAHRPIRAARTPRRSPRNDAAESSTPAYGRDDTSADPLADLSGTARPDFIPQTAADRARYTTLLISAFNDSSHSLGREDETQWVRGRTSERIKRWCEKTLNAIITRQSGGVPLCPDLNKRANCEQRPDYATFEARFQAVVKALQTEKRACKRFQREHGWAKRIADDPVYEESAILNNDGGNHARAEQDRKKKENDFSMLEGWKRLRAGGALTTEEIEHYIPLAEFNTETAKKSRRPATPVTSARGQGRRFGMATNDLGSGRMIALAASLAVQSPYFDEDSSLASQPAREDLGKPDSTKKRKLNNGIASFPGTPTPVRLAGLKPLWVNDRLQQQFTARQQIPGQPGDSPSPKPSPSFSRSITSEQPTPKTAFQQWQEADRKHWVEVAKNAERRSIEGFLQQPQPFNAAETRNHEVILQQFKSHQGKKLDAYLEKSKDNATAIVQDLQDLKQVLLGAPSDVTVDMLLKKFDHIEKLAIYIQDPPKAEQAAEKLLGRVRETRINNTSEESAADGIESLDADAVLFSDTTQATPPSINQQMRNTRLGGSSSKKKKLTDGHSVPQTPTPLWKVYPASFQSSPQMAPPASPYADASIELKTRSALPHNVSAEVEDASAQPDSRLPAKPASLDPYVICSIEEIRKWHVLQRAYSLQCLDQIQKQEHGDFLHAQRQILTKEGRQRHAQDFFDDRQEQCIRRVGELDRKLSEHAVCCLENRKSLQQALAIEGALDPALTD